MTYTPAEKRADAKRVFEATKARLAQEYQADREAVAKSLASIDLSIFEAIAADYAERDLLDGGAG